MAKKYNEVPVKNNMNIEKDDNNEEVVEQKKKLNKLVDKAPKKRKRGLFGRLVSGVLGPEGASGIGQYVSDEIIIPAVRNIIYSAIESTARMAIFGEKGGPIGGNRHVNSSRQATNYRPSTNYSSRYEAQRPEHTDRRVARPARYGVDEYIIEDRYDAANILATLKENADRYDVVSVADYYDLIGVASEYTDNNYGWTIDSIVNASILPIRGGFIIKFPPVEVI